MVKPDASPEALKVFLSYSRRDMTFADEFVAALEGAGISVTIDRRDLPYGEEWQAELADFIRASDTVVWLVSPDSIGSRWCNWELGEVTRLSKRLVPVRIRPVDPAALPEAVGRIHLLPAEGTFDLGQHLTPLVDALNTDRSWLKDSTRLADRARQWLARGRDGGLLLRGAGLTDAERWSARHPHHAPLPSSEVLDLILASRRARTQRGRAVVAISLAAAVIGLGLAAAAFQNARRAERERDQALTTQSRFLGDLAQQEVGAGNAVKAMLLALEGLPDRRAEDALQQSRPYSPEAELGLFTAWRQKREAVVFEGHKGAVYSAAFSPDEKLVVTASQDGTARIFDVRTGMLVATMAGHAGAVLAAQFSPDGGRVLTASRDGTARIWEPRSGRQVVSFYGHGGEVTSAVFSPDGKRVLTASADKTARIWDAVSGETLGVLSGHTDKLASAAFSPDGKRIFTASADHTARLWDAVTRDMIAEMSGHSGAIFHAAFSPDGKRMATGAWGDNDARLWDGLTGRLVKVLAGHRNHVLYVSFSPDGRRLATASADNTVRLWDGITGEPAGEPLEGHTDWVRHAAFNPQGNRLATTGSDATVRIWNVANGEELITLRGHEFIVQSVSYSRDGLSLLTASQGATARLWHLEPESTATEIRGHKSPVVAARFTAGGARVLTLAGGFFGRDDETARLWFADDGHPLEVLGNEERSSLSGNRLERTLSLDVSRDGTRILTAYVSSKDGPGVAIWNAADGSLLKRFGAGDGEPVISLVRFSPDAAQFVTVANIASAHNAVVRILDSSDGTVRHVLDGHAGEVESVAFSADGARLVTASRDKHVRLWDVHVGRLLRALETSDEAWLASISPDGTRIVSGTRDGGGILWRADTGERIAELKGHRMTMGSAVFSPDGSRLVTTGRDMLANLGFDSQARLWDGLTGAPRGTLAGHTNTVVGAVFNAAGTRILTAAADGSARLWDTASATLIGVLSGHGEIVYTAGFNTDETRVVTASKDKRALIWRVFPTTEALVAHAKTVVPRCLTRQEREAAFLPAEPPAWCITGPNQGENDATRWQPKWPYHWPEWRQWLIDRRNGRDPPLPEIRCPGAVHCW